MKKESQFNKYFGPIEFPKDDQRNRMSRILYAYWINIWVIFGLMILAALFIFVNKIGVAVFLVFYLIIQILVRITHLKGQVRFASYLMLFGLWITYMSAIVLSGTVRTTLTAVALAIVVMFISLTSLRTGTLIAALTLLLAFVVTLFEISGAPLPKIFPNVPLSNWFHLVTALVVVIIPLGQTWKELTAAVSQNKKSERKHRLLFEEANDGIFLIKDNEIVDCNTKALEMFMTDLEDLIGKAPHQISTEFQPNGILSTQMEQINLEMARKGDRQVFEWRHIRNDGSEFDVEVSLNLLELEDDVLIQAILRDITERKRAEKELAEAYDTTLEGWAKALELRDKETSEHSRRVIDLTIKLSNSMGIKGNALVDIRRGAILHDIGKIGIPNEILNKPGVLTPEERKIVEQHPIFSFELLKDIPHLERAMDIPVYHHERWDGSGYSNGLEREEIPLTARIFSVVDVWDALLSDRPYRKALSREEAINHIRQESGKHFDPDIVDCFLKLIEKGNV